MKNIVLCNDITWVKLRTIMEFYLRNLNVGRQHRFWRRMLVELSVSKNNNTKCRKCMSMHTTFYYEKHLVFVLYFIILCLFFENI